MQEAEPQQAKEKTAAGQSEGRWAGILTAREQMWMFFEDEK